PSGYPQDNITTPNTAVARLNGKDPDKRIGPSIILKVMAGDTIQAAVRAYYKKQAAPKKNASIPAEQMLAGLLQAFTAPAMQAISAHEMSAATNARKIAPGLGLTAADLQSLKQKDPNNKKLDKPKAYLNYVFFDNQLNFVEEGSGLKQVDGEAGELETLSSEKVVAKKDGYVYIFTSNESQQDVFFDNLGVTQITRPILEETHYYPFGLTMAGISQTAPLKIQGRRKFNGIAFNHEEFSDESGLELYTAYYRNLDPQIG